MSADAFSGVLGAGRGLRPDQDADADRARLSAAERAAQAEAAEAARRYEEYLESERGADAQAAAESRQRSVEFEAALQAALTARTEWPLGELREHLKAELPHLSRWVQVYLLGCLGDGGSLHADAHWNVSAASPRPSR